MGLLLLFMIIFVFAHNAFAKYNSIIFEKNDDPAFQVKFPDYQNFFEKQYQDPVGHMEPFGKQRPPTAQVPEYFEEPTPRMLWENHIKYYRPAVYRNLFNGSFALHKWTDDYLTKSYGDLEVLVEKKLEDRMSEPKRMTLASFLNQYEHQNWYVVTVLPNAMKKDLRTPKPLMCSSLRANLMELNLWIGTKGTRSMLHYDADNIIHCLVSGRKDWMLVHPDHVVRSDMGFNNPGQQSGYSLLDVDSIDLYNNPDVSDISWEYVTLLAGDCVYVPPGYMHQVRSYNRSISSTFLIYPHHNFEDDDCKNIDLDKYENMENLYSYWGYEKDQETVDMGYRNPIEMKSQLLEFINIFQLNSTELSFYNFLYITTSLGINLMENITFARNIFSSADISSDGYLQYNEVEILDIETIKEICRGTDSSHGPTKSLMNAENNLSDASSEFKPRFHLHYVEASYCRKFLNYLLTKYGSEQTLTYPKFVEVVDVNHGTLPEAFLLLDTNMNGRLTNQEIMNRPKEKLQKFYSLEYKLKTGENIKAFLFEDEEEMGDTVKYAPLVLNVLSELLHSFDVGDINEIDETQFHELFKGIEYRKKLLKIDSKFIFNILNSSGKRFLTIDDIRKVFNYNVKLPETNMEDLPEGLRRIRKYNQLANMSYSKWFRLLMDIVVGINFLPSFDALESAYVKDEL